MSKFIFHDDERIFQIMKILGIDQDKTIGFTLEVMIDELPTLTVCQYIEESEGGRVSSYQPSKT